MKWRIILKILYLVTLFVLAAHKQGNESQLIDSDPKVDPAALQQAYNRA
ncbi:MAG: hypothetical protein GDA51_10910 [Ekhidna sp.]|nr:hypothetical protein [Ekhidna sp.]MBC6426950.1 hypothetical protein [Ekhidna sp.]